MTWGLFAVSGMRCPSEFENGTGTARGNLSLKGVRERLVSFKLELAKTALESWVGRLHPLLLGNLVQDQCLFCPF